MARRKPVEKEKTSSKVEKEDKKNSKAKKKTSSCKNLKNNTSEDLDNSEDEEVIETPTDIVEDDLTKDSEETPEEKKPKEKKVITLKQWFMTGEDKTGKKYRIFLLATCGMKAREFFKEKYPEAEITSAIYVAESEKTAEWLKTHSPFQN